MFPLALLGYSLAGGWACAAQSLRLSGLTPAWLRIVSCCGPARLTVIGWRLLADWCGGERRGGKWRVGGLAQAVLGRAETSRFR